MTFEFLRLLQAVNSLSKYRLSDHCDQRQITHQLGQSCIKNILVPISIDHRSLAYGLESESMESVELVSLKIFAKEIFLILNYSIFMHFIKTCRSSCSAIVSQLRINESINLIINLISTDCQGFFM